MSTKTREQPKRRYRKRRRAAQEDETRQRITEAAVDLHGSVGPARTTVSAVAECAGVQRATVYRHFPDEQALFDACSSHWLQAHPLPDLEEWATIADPEERLRVALDRVYAWYERGEQMLEKTTRDAVTVPALEPSMAAFGAWIDAAADVLMRGRGLRGRRRKAVRAGLAHALGFAAWRSLARAQRLDRAAAIGLMTGMVAAASRD
jgi:AcrR family transcriptional regulator